MAGRGRPDAGGREGGAEDDGRRELDGGAGAEGDEAADGLMNALPRFQWLSGDSRPTG